jgi:Trk K+ transport system NAD-binding subunit
MQVLTSTSGSDIVLNKKLLDENEIITYIQEGDRAIIICNTGYLKEVRRLFSD